MVKWLLQPAGDDSSEATETHGRLFDDPDSASLIIRSDEVEMRVHTEILNDFFKQAVEMLSDDEENTAEDGSKIIKLPGRFSSVLELYRSYMYLKPVEIEGNLWKLFCELVVFTTNDVLDPVLEETLAVVEATGVEDDGGDVAVVEVSGVEDNGAGEEGVKIDAE